MGSSAEASGYFLWLVRKTSPLPRACLLKCPAETIPSGRADCFNFLNQAGSKNLVSGGGMGRGGEMLVRISEFKNPNSKSEGLLATIGNSIQDTKHKLTAPPTHPFTCHIMCPDWCKHGLCPDLLQQLAERFCFKAGPHRIWSHCRKCLAPQFRILQTCMLRIVGTALCDGTCSLCYHKFLQSSFLGGQYFYMKIGIEGMERWLSS